MSPEPRNSEPRNLIRHTVATLAYRADKVLRDVPDGFADYRLSSASRTPLEIVSHLGDLVEWADRMAKGEYRWTPVPSSDWKSACDRFFKGLLALDASLETSPLTEYPAETIFQGPIADSLTHVGQIAMLRGAFGAPVRPESYARAQIEVGRVGTEQSTTRKEFDGDASIKR